jgi:hypothetical protein
VQTLPGDAVAFSSSTEAPDSQAFAINRQTRKPIFANQGNQESRSRIPARRSLQAGIDPNEVCLEKPVAPPLPNAACLNHHLLELAKGFEPPTP